MSFCFESGGICHLFKTKEDNNGTLSNETELKSEESMSEYSVVGLRKTRRYNKRREHKILCR